MKSSTTLRKNFEKAVADYVAALLKQFGWDAHYGYWIGDDMTGVYAYGDAHFISLEDIIYIVDNNVLEQVFDEWEDYCLFAHEYGQHIPNLHSWVMGCPHLSKEERAHLEGLKKDLDDAVKNYKEKY